MNLFSRLKNTKSRLKNGLFATLFLFAYGVSAIAPFIPATASAAAVQGQCTKDAQGANDQPGQKDLTQFCPYTGDDAGYLTVGWAWDDNSFPGKNTGDACALFDTDGDGNSNYAVCVTIAGNPAKQVAGSPFVYSCDDTSVYNCDNAKKVNNSTTTCTLSTSTNPFDNTQSDTYVECKINLADVGGASAVLKDVCSYPSTSRPSDPSDCIVTPTAHTPSATIQIKKILSPAADEGTFNLNINGSTYFTGGNNADTGAITVTPATGIVVSETAATGSLANYSTTVSCLNGTSLVTGTTDLTSTTERTITLTVADKDAVVCTFTNTRLTSSVRVIKDVDNGDGGNLTYANFTYYNGLTPITLAPTAAYPSPDGETTLQLPVGSTFNITEADAPQLGYTRSYSGVCSGTVTVTTNIPTCTIKNDDKPASLTVVKKIVNDNGGSATVSDFGITSNGSALSFGAGVVSGDTTSYTASPSVKANMAYNLNEGTVSGYKNGTWSCTDDVTGATVSEPVTLALGQKVTCEITNDDQPATLIVKKIVNNTYGGTKTAGNFSFSVNGATATPFTELANDSLRGENSVNLNAGEYSVEEPEAFSGNYTTTYSDDCVGAMNVGDSKTCTITNSDTFASITGTKFILNSTDQLSASSDQSSATGWTIYLYKLNTTENVWDYVNSAVTDADANYSFGDLAAGTYQVFETFVGQVVDEWTQLFGNTSSGASITDATATTNQLIQVAMGESYGNNNSTWDAAFDFGNFRNGTISGYKWNDEDGDGRWATFVEPKLGGWTIQLKDGQGSVIQEQVTGDDGTYSFGNVAPGTYQVCEVMQTNWAQTYPSESSEPACHQVTMDESGEAVMDQNFGNQAQAKLKIVKDIFPNKDEGLFNLLIDEEAMATDVSDGGTTDFVTLPVGQHEIAESAGTDTSLENYDSYYECVRAGETMQFIYDYGTMTLVDLKLGDEVTCTFHNQRHGLLTIIKHAEPNDAQDFEFELSSRNVEETFSLDDDPTDETLPNSITYELSGNYYSLRELQTEGWDLTDVDCGDGLLDYGEDGWVYVAVDAGMETVCHFTNTKRATVSITKDSQPNASQSFNFSTNIQNDDTEESTSFSLSDDGVLAPLSTKVFGNVYPGEYTITEADAAGWKLDSITCVGAEVVRDGAKVSIEVMPGAEVHCTFVNKKVTVPQVLGVTITKMPKLEDTGSNLILPVLVAMLTTSVALLAYFDKPRRVLSSKVRSSVAEPFVLPGL